MCAPDSSSRCPYFEKTTNSPYYAGIRCNAYERGREKLKFINDETADLLAREEYLSRHCFGDFQNCEIYKSGVVQEAEESKNNTWLYVVRLKDRTFWSLTTVATSAESCSLNRAYLVKCALDFQGEITDYHDLQAQMIHFSSPGFHEYLDDLEFDDFSTKVQLPREYGWRNEPFF